jgi:hypothetical protein
MEQSVDKKLFPPIEKTDWERVLQIMNKHNRINGYVDYDPNGKMQFYDSDPFIGGVHAMLVDKKSITEIIKSYK